MTAKLTAPLRRAPATVPALVALALLVAWATDQAGFPQTHWGPGAVAVIVLLAITAALVKVRLAEIPPAVRVALGALALYTAFSFLSILWAGVQADAWEGADRTLLYLCVFALFACWGQRGETAALLLVAWTLGLIGVGAFTLVHLSAASAAHLQSMLPGGRLEYPSGYANANAAQWLMAFWPAVLMARSERLPWLLRGLLAGGAVLLAEVALLSQSRGSLFATPVMLVLVFVLLPGRVRTFALLVPVVLGIGAAAPSVLRVGDHLRNDSVVPSTLHAAIAASAIAAVVVAIVVAAGAAIESRAEPSPATASAVRRGVGAVALVALVAVVIGGLIAAGNPITRLEHGWRSFKGGYTASTDKDRLISGLGSNRYDFYRVALDEFVKHPLAGIGVDNFQQQYLLHGRSTETPRYPHSVELRALAQTGLIGTLIGAAGLLAALLAVFRAMRSDDRLAAAVAAAALSGFAYWFVHGSVDWFWEFAGLGAPAFALLGIACSLAPRRAVAAPEGNSAHAAPAPRAPTRRRALLIGGLGALAALVAAGALIAPTLSQLEVDSAARIWPAHPREAYDRLSEAASLNPLSDEPYRVGGSIALRFGELQRADGDFTRALRRSRNDAYPTLQLGAIASNAGERERARSLLRRAVQLSPREPLAREALAVVERGGTLSVRELDRSILLKAREL
jgi:O-antigen ligase